VLGRVSERFREAVKAQAEREEVPVYQFQHKQRKDGVANNFRGSDRCATVLSSSGWRKRSTGVQLEEGEHAV
jgi:hypothetical protein